MELSDFKQSLNDGKYGSITGARKAIGRVNGWSEEQRAEGHKIANKHFGEEAVAAKPAKAKPAKEKVKKGVAKPKRVAKAKAVKAKAEAVEAKPAKEKKDLKAAKAKRTYTRRAQVAETTQASPAVSTRTHVATGRPDYSHVNEAIDIIKKDLDVAMISKALGPESASIAQLAEKANQVLIRCADEVHAIVEKASVMTDKVSANFAKAVAATSPGVPETPPTQVQNSTASNPFSGFSFPTTPQG